MVTVEHKGSPYKNTYARIHSSSPPVVFIPAHWQPSALNSHKKKENKAGIWKSFASVFVSLSFPPSGGGHPVVATVTWLSFKEHKKQSAT